ncbi:MAG: hypothetical protein AB3N21_02140 [Ruegeria sp.]|uniref:hypothetical protein n=1 Tax=Ruegeria sp. TaxID=1879320 RepID=UPI00349E9701
MLNVAQRIDLMKLAIDVAKSEASGADQPAPRLLDRTLQAFTAIKAAVESGDPLDDTKITDVKAAFDMASEIEELID